MPSQICLRKPQNSRRFITKRVNTPVKLNLLQFPNNEFLGAKQSPDKRKASRAVKPAAGCEIALKANLEKDEVHVRSTYVNSLDTFWQKRRCGCVSSCKKYLEEFKKAIYSEKLLESGGLEDEDGNTLTIENLADFQADGKGGIVGISGSTRDKVTELCKKISDLYVDSIINKRIGRLCELHYDNFDDDDGDGTHRRFCQRACETRSLQEDAQGILDQSYRIGVASGTCDGKATIDYIVGSATKKPKVFCFKSAEERDLIVGKTSFNRKLSFGVKDSDSNDKEASRMVSSARVHWGRLGDLVERVVLHRIAVVLPLADDVTQMSQWDDSEFNSVDVSAMDSELAGSLYQAVLGTFETGYLAGYRAGQETYKNHTELDNDPWTYFLADDGLYISTKPVIRCGFKRNAEGCMLLQDCKPKKK